MAGPKTKVGNVEIVALSDGSLEFPLQNLFPSVSAQDWRPYRELLTGNGSSARLNVGSYILRSGGRTVLVDTGFGEAPIPDIGWPGGRLLTAMQGEGLRPEEVEVVVFTHLHPDHTGWNYRQVDGVPQLTFPRARYVVHQADWDFFTSPQGLEEKPYIRRSVLPLRETGRLELVKDEHALADELTLLLTPGHTPGHISILIASAGQLGVVLGDVAYHMAQVQEVQWMPRFDVDPELAAHTRSQLIQRLEREEGLVVAGHFPEPGFGRLVRLEGRRSFQAL